jgi:hypothetical protein
MQLPDTLRPMLGPESTGLGMAPSENRQGQKNILQLFSKKRKHCWQERLGLREKNSRLPSRPALVNPSRGGRSTPPPKKRNAMPWKNNPPVSQPRNAAAGPKAPVKTLRLGRIKAAIWENESDNQKFYNVTFARGYLDEAKNWHDSDSFGRDDLLLVAKLADQAHTFIFEQCAHAKAEPGG